MVKKNISQEEIDAEVLELCEKIKNIIRFMALYSKDEPPIIYPAEEYEKCEKRMAELAKKYGLTITKTFSM